MERHPNWYSIVRYSPSALRGEIVNVGVIVHSPESGEIFYKLIKNTNTKLKSILVDKNSLELYKVHYDFIDFYIKKSMKNEDLFLTSSGVNLFETLAGALPKQLILSEPTFALTDSPKALLNILLDTYIGKEFLITEDLTHTNVRHYVKTVFSERKLLDTKIKANAKIYPFPEKRLINFNVDFVYKNGIVNFMQTIPSKDNIKNWFNKLYSFMDSYNNEAIYNILIDSQSQIMYDDAFIEMVELLKEKATLERFKTVDVHSTDFEILCNKIDTDGRPIDEFQHELVM